MKIVIPDIPPSDNLVYRKRGNGYGMFMTDEGKAWKEMVSWYSKKYKPLPGPVRLTLDVFFTDNRARDILNYQKLTCDALQGFLYINDKQIQTATLTKHACSPQKMTIIKVEAIQIPFLNKNAKKVVSREGKKEK